ncbi:hypothetical protein HWV62_8146 [Athelia sp. TMB]|nr:hypothetical protein HWV62_8146 [Athelia sp. TMB]
MDQNFNFPFQPSGFPLRTPSRANGDALDANGTPQYTRYGSPTPEARHDESPPPIHGHQPTGSSFMPQAPLIDMLTVDNLVKDFDLEPQQRANIGSADGLLGKSDLLTRLYMLIAMYSEAAERRRTIQSQGFENVKELFDDLKTRLEGTFSLTKPQMKYIRKNHASMGLTNTLATPAREQHLASVCKKVSSSVRNAFRQDIRDSILHSKKKTSLSLFTYASAMKYRRGQFEEDMGVGYTIHNALLRRFGLDNVTLIELVAPANDDDDDSELIPDDSAATGSKRKQGGRIPKGEDFWARVDAYFASHIESKGSNLLDMRWKEHVSDIIQRDNAIFSPRAITPDVQLQAPAQGTSLMNAFS